MRFLRLRRIHFVGAGGVGMSGIAEILLLATPLEITGCDSARSENTARLEKLGAKIAIGHDPSHAQSADLLVISSAIGEANAEVAAARERGIPVIRRAEMLGEIMRLKQGVAVAGTHGKTTTTSLTGLVLTEAGFDPTIVVGGRVHILGTNARLGKGEYLVAEADEYDRSFLELTPVVAVITNVEADHLDNYGTEAAYRDAFAQFLDRIDVDGFLAACVDDEGAAALAEQARDRGLQVVGVGESAAADLRAIALEIDGATSSFDVVDGDSVAGRVRLQVPGRHYVLDALTALAAGLRLGFPFDALSRGLGSFTGTRRRMEPKGEAAGVRVYDSYAHHPREIAADLEAARALTGDGRLVVAYQPHLVSRTRIFGPAMGEALGAADEVVVLDVYVAREEPDPAVTGALVAGHVPLPPTRVHFEPSFSEVPGLLMRIAQPGDLVLTLGAGDVTRIGPEVLVLLEQQQSNHDDTDPDREG